MSLWILIARSLRTIVTPTVCHLLHPSYYSFQSRNQKPWLVARGSCLCASNSARRSFCSSACCVCRFLPEGLFIIIGKKTKLEKSWQVCVACHKTMSSLKWSSSRSRLNTCLRSTQQARDSHTFRSRQPGIHSSCNLCIKSLFQSKGMFKRVVVATVTIFSPGIVADVPVATDRYQRCFVLRTDKSSSSLASAVTPRLCSQRGQLGSSCSSPRFPPFSGSIRLAESP